MVFHDRCCSPLIESKLLLDVCYRSAENMLAEMNTVHKFN